MKRRQSFLEDARLDRRLALIGALYLVLIASIVGYNAVAIGRERGAALIVNIAARQRALAEAYVKDVILKSQGFQADPESGAVQLLTNAEALLHGGDVTAVQGADADVTIPVASKDGRVIVKLEEEQRLIEALTENGVVLLTMDPSDAGYDEQLLRLRVSGAQVSSISNDAVGQMTLDTEAAFSRLVRVSIALGVLGAILALAMGLLLRRVSARRAARFRSLVDNASDVITVLDPKNTIRYQTDSGGRLLGVPPDQLLGTNYTDLVDPEDRDHLTALLSQLATSADRTATAQYRVRQADGGVRHVESITTNLVHESAIRGLVLNTRDVTERKKLEDALAHQAYHDSLTGLSNRGVFREMVEHALTRSRRNNMRVAVLILDLDGFKTVNDSQGHDVGDHLLVEVGARLKSCARASDVVARLGGDEFAVLLEDGVNDVRAKGMARRLLEELTAPFEVGGKELFIGASVGIAFNIDEATQPDTLIRNADTAMYAAKGSGKGRFEVFQPLMHRRAREQFEVQSDLQHAMGRGEFVLNYQPIVDVPTQAILGMEALIRWEHPTRGLLPPLEFIPTAEEIGLIVPLGRWVLMEACRQTAEWRARYPTASDLYVSVNLSTRQLLEPDLVAQVEDVLAVTGLDPSALMLEITEGSLMQGVTETAAKLRELKALGVRLAVDDFGTGSSSLGYLRRFPIDVLKIDKSFVDEITEEGPDGPALVRAIIDLAKNLHMATVAEGIEQTEQLAELRAAGCGSGQGYLFARPLRSEAMASLLDGSQEGALAAG
jgi:diguanylate cyclase (GGDEF)-like protein/PAS domain S-box-containing protein